MSFPRVVGYCPMGCGQTLFLGEGGHVTCSHLDCSNPEAVDIILNESLVHHEVTLGDATWNVIHPLRERIDDQVLDCSLGEYLESLSGPPRQPGRYLVWLTDAGWEFMRAYRREDLAAALGVTDHEALDGEEAH